MMRILFAGITALLFVQTGAFAQSPSPSPSPSASASPSPLAATVVAPYRSVALPNCDVIDPATDIRPINKTISDVVEPLMLLTMDDSTLYKTQMESDLILLHDQITPIGQKRYLVYRIEGSNLDLPRTPEEMSMILQDQNGQNVQTLDPFARAPKANITNVTIHNKATNVTYPLFMGQSSKGEHLIGVSRVQKWGNPDKDRNSLTWSSGAVWHAEKTMLGTPENTPPGEPIPVPQGLYEATALYLDNRITYLKSSDWKKLSKEGNLQGRLTSTTYLGVTPIIAKDMNATGGTFQLSTEPGAEAKLKAGNTQIRAKVGSQWVAGAKDIKQIDATSIRPLHNVTYLRVDGSAPISSQLRGTFDTMLGVRENGTQFMGTLGVQSVDKKYLVKAGYQNTLNRTALAQQNSERVFLQSEKAILKGMVMVTLNVDQPIGQPMSKMQVQGGLKGTIPYKKRR